MSLTFEAVVTNGVLRPKSPVNLPEGKEVRVTVAGSRMSTADFESALDELQAAAREHPDEWWDDFQEELSANRVVFEER